MDNMIHLENNRELQALTHRFLSGITCSVCFMGNLSVPNVLYTQYIMYCPNEVQVRGYLWANSVSETREGHQRSSEKPSS